MSNSNCPMGDYDDSDGDGPSVNLSARMNEPLTNRECLEQRAVCISQDGDIYIATTSILVLYNWLPNL